MLDSLSIFLCEVSTSHYAAFGSSSVKAVRAGEGRNTPKMQFAFAPLDLVTFNMDSPPPVLTPFHSQGVSPAVTLRSR